ncbi:MAG: hypothetical protein HSCHL_0972 [Hydrogenibacillus schlegelii]|uniref:Uncharacterized protein n=1 Tax=Hydrogenibacillus schlegelii TaxID=1484 RepID=A0A2T5G6S3_HYDSH|nr:hypothetical protein [Hydrogenibacillus schlegelii]PTQ51896.1 MAG: hypothetical protein HSCHL_0972 [Hydrogenibacillus schlegelii]
MKLSKDAKDVQTPDGTYSADDQTITWPIDFSAKGEQTFKFSYQQPKSYVPVILRIAAGTVVAGLLVLGIIAALAARDRKKAAAPSGHPPLPPQG